MDELKDRKTTRLMGADYNKSQAVFLTICTKERRCVLARIVGNGVPDGSKFELTRYGKIADKYIRRFNDFYDDLSVESYVIMPNHIHLLLRIKGTKGKPSGTPPPRCKIPCRRALYLLSKDFATKNMAKTYGNIVPMIISFATARTMKNICAIFMKTLCVGTAINYMQKNRSNGVAQSLLYCKSEAYDKTEQP